MALIFEDNGEGKVAVSGIEGACPQVLIPEEYDGKIVNKIMPHVFERNELLESVVLPQSIEQIGSFAFHDCRNLHSLTLYNDIYDYYDGVLKQCDSLENIEVYADHKPERAAGTFEIIRNILADSDATLKIKIHMADGTALLVFPGFVYASHENTMARTIQFTIEGSGYAFRECVDREKINFDEYDRLFIKAVADDSDIAQDIAISRVMYPYSLRQDFEEKYREYIGNNCEHIISRMIDLNDLDVISFLSDHELIPVEKRENCIKMAADRGKTQISAILVSKSQENTRTVMELEDW